VQGEGAVNRKKSSADKIKKKRDWRLTVSRVLVVRVRAQQMASLEISIFSRRESSLLNSFACVERFIDMVAMHCYRVDMAAACKSTDEEWRNECEERVRAVL
jgi:hypothetical protein